jgi:metal-sulfur cluster biosynthetic enzyme
MIAPPDMVAALDAVSGAGDRDRRLQAFRAIELIVDPCSRALDCPIGLVGMGMIAGLDERDGRVEVEVLPTFPTCMFRGVIEEEIEARIRALPWAKSVAVRFASADQIWDETRMSADARTKLVRIRRRAA